MGEANSCVLNRVFTRGNVREWIEAGTSEPYRAAVQRYVPLREGLTNEECLYNLYRVLKRQYRNEYYYKNTILNKLLLGVHSTRTTAALTELPVGRSKADFILINGDAVVYEIKTELDNLDKLSGQISDYYTAFRRVAVVTSESSYGQVRQMLADQPTGIYVLTERGQLSCRKKPGIYEDALSSRAMFRILRKYEWEAILLEAYGALPQVSQFDYYRTCEALFMNMQLHDARTAMVRALKRRTRVDEEMYGRIPYDLKFVVYFSELKKKDYQKLENFLHAEWGKFQS